MKKNLDLYKKHKIQLDNNENLLLQAGKKIELKNKKGVAIEKNKDSTPKILLSNIC
jgi:hypothetical protein